jgi:ribosomal protein L37AE/L43A
MAMGYNEDDPLRFSILGFAAAILLATWYFSIRRKRPSIMVWLACCAPISLFLPLVQGTSWLARGSRFDIIFLSAAGVSAVSWIVSVYSYFRMKKLDKCVWAVLAIPVVFVVVTIGGISVDKSLHDIAEFCGSPPVEEHYCPKCGKPMNSAYYYCRYWYCDACGYNKDFADRSFAEGHGNSPHGTERRRETENQ